MASHKGWDEQFAVTSVATTGGSLNLGRGQLALLNMSAPPSSTGLKIIDNLDGLPKKNEFQLRIGKHDVRNNRSQSSKNWSSQTFTINEVLDLKVDAPQLGIETDEILLGYDGINADTAIVLGKGENEVIGVNLSGEVIGAIGYQDSSVELQLYLDQNNAGTLKSMQEVVETAVKQFNEMTLMGDIPVTTYVTAIPVNSKNTALTGTDNAFYSLVVKDRGDSAATGLVQAQYGKKVVKTERSGEYTTYTLIDAPGASIADFVINPAWKVKGCATCPSGYDTYSDGIVYSVRLEDDGADSTAAVEAISTNVEAGSAISVGIEQGFSTYTFVTSAKLTDAEKEVFIASNPETEISLVSEDVYDICKPTNNETFAWVEGKTCKTSTEVYTITVADDKCGNSMLAEIEAVYPELTIVQGVSGGCQTVYTTPVVTNIICDECSDIFRALFVSDAPQDFQGTSWEKVASVYDDTALMGIKFKATEVQLSGSEEYRDDLPFIATSARLSIAGGHEHNVNESFLAGTAGRFAAKLLNIASEPENWGGNLRDFEDMTRVRQEGVGRHVGNNYGKWILGEETLLKANVPYIDYALTVRISKMAQSFSGELNETIIYHYYVEPGTHIDVENVLNSIATAAGLDPVQAYATTV